MPDSMGDDPSVQGRVLVGIATFNERENLPSLVKSILQWLPECHIVVVDDDSPDGTGEWADAYAVRESRLHVIHRERKLGLGTAALASILHALHGNYRFLVQLDADHSHPPEVIPQMLALIATTCPPIDVVVGSRYVNGGAIVGWPLSRRWASRGVNSLARWGLRIPVRDCSGSFRCYRVATLREIDWSQLRSPGYSVYEELLAILHCHGAQMVEIPITFTNRQQGKTKVDWREMGRSAWQLLKLAWEFRRRA